MKAIFTVLLFVGAISCCLAQYRLPKTNDAIELFNAGLALAKQNHFDQAAEKLRQAETIEPKSSQIRYIRGICLYTGGHDDEGIAELQEALRLDPSFKDAQTQLQFAQKQKIDDQADSYYSAARAAAIKNDDDATLQNASACLKLRPHDPDALMLEGAALMDLNQDVAGRAALRQAIKYGNAKIIGECQKEINEEDNNFADNIIKTGFLFFISLLWLWFRSPILTRRALAYPNDRSVVPPLNGFNFGIAFFTIFWGLANRVNRALWGLIPSYGFFVHIYYGFVGQNRAWYGPRQQTARAFALTQLAWAKAVAWLWIGVHVIWLATTYHERDSSGFLSQGFVLSLLILDIVLVVAMAITTRWYLNRLPPAQPVAVMAMPGQVVVAGNIPTAGPVCRFCGQPAEPGVAACKNCGAPI